MPSPWTTTAEASAETGLTITQDQLDRAAKDVHRIMRWIPTDADFPAGSDLALMQLDALATAVAWQAAHRQEAGPGIGGGGVASESLADYSVTYNTTSSGVGTGGVHARARSILAAAGLMRLTARSTLGVAHSELED